MHRTRLEPFARGRLWLAAAVLALTAVTFNQARTQQKPPDPEVKTQSTTPGAQTDDAALAIDKKLIESAKDGSEVMKNITYLSDVIGPRLTGSDNLKRANEWAAEKMKAYGLT